MSESTFCATVSLLFFDMEFYFSVDSNLCTNNPLANIFGCWYVKFIKTNLCTLLILTELLITRDLCCSAFVKDAAEDLMDQYGGGGGEGVSTHLLCTIKTKKSLL